MFPRPLDALQCVLYNMGRNYIARGGTNEKIHCTAAGIRFGHGRSGQRRGQL